jgi:endonuclease/exonuclease/phosphatase family metal-dependent hydrolase
LREKIARGRIAARLANVPRCLIGIEAGMATHYVARELSALGHIDYIFVPTDWLKHLVSFEIGTFEDWFQHSDHAPLSAEFTRSFR